MRRAVALLTTFALVGCTNTGSPTARPAPALKLVSYTSCDDLLSSVREAAKKSVGPWGFTNNRGHWFGLEDARAAAPAAPAQSEAGAKGAPVQGQDYSGTNTHTAGVDEPDLVKTDGKRIVVVQNGTLHVIDAASKRETSRVPLEVGAFQLLLHQDRALVMSNVSGKVVPFDMPADSRIASPGYFQSATKIQLFDLRDVPKVVGEFKIDAQLVDARQVGGTARIVVRNSPAIAFPVWRDGAKEDQRIAANRDIIDKTPLDNWLPSYTVNGQTKKPDCSDVSRPDNFSGSSLVTLLSFNLSGAGLSEGDPTAIFADGDTIYGSGPNLYLAHDQRWRGWRGPDVWGETQRKDVTEIFQFDVTAAKPVYVAGGTVPGWLLNQYSLSEHDGILRAATTNTAPWETPQKSSSTVYTLQRDEGALRQVGSVGGLGKGERIYAVRFVGPVGYVVTFRQVDPLYTIDLSDPKRPKVIGELKITGYSAYLHPISPGRLIGVGQEATEQGRTTGTQISLFDVSNLADPKRLDQHRISRSHSEAEHDPHAFLYWPATRLLVIPVNQDALLLRVEDSKLVELGEISHAKGYDGFIRRSLVIGDALWTISNQGAMASTLDGGQKLAWVPL